MIILMHTRTRTSTRSDTDRYTDSDLIDSLSRLVVGFSGSKMGQMMRLVEYYCSMVKRMSLSEIGSKKQKFDIYGIRTHAHLWM